MPLTQWPLQSQADAFYGNPRGVGGEVNPTWEAENIIAVPCPWPLHFDQILKTSIRIHHKCAESLTRILNNIFDAVGRDVSQINKLRYDQFSGSYNYRNKRGATSLSMHAYGAAIDFDYVDNQFHSVHHLFTDQSLLVIKFKEEGWIWGGDWSPGSIDAMHQQAARIHD